MGQEQGFFHAIFDLSFNDFVTTKIVKGIYILAMLVAALVGLGALIQGLLGDGLMSKVGGLVLGPLFFLLIIVSTRIWLELVIVIFRIAEHASEIAMLHRKATNAPG